MAGVGHRLLVQMLVPRLRSLGYKIVGSDVQYAILGGTRVPVPPAIVRHEPDLLGVRRDPPVFCIGEAKTLGDLGTRHSREQYADFASVPDCRVILALPSSGLETARRVLAQEHIDVGPQFELMGVPDLLLTE